MTLVFLLNWGAGMIVLARYLCGCWLNHLSLYTFVWTLSLSAYELHWIRYNSISGEAWLYIFIAWVAIYMGTAVITPFHTRRPKPISAACVPRLKSLIVLFSLAGLASCVVLAWQIMKEVDPNLLIALTVGASKIYSAGFEETGQFVGIPYIGFLPLAASPLAGAYAAKKGRISWTCLLPLIVATITGILSVQRFLILLSAALFLVAFYLTPRSDPVRLSRLQKGLLGLACATGLIFVTLMRVDLASSMGNQTSTLNEISNWIPVAPSLYFYVSGPPVGLSEYLREQGREANLPWGRYTFASVYRFLSKLGLATYVPFHQDFYSTPEPINTCTYLREVHSDFGVLGIFLFPFLLGAVSGWLASHRENLVRIMLLAHAYIVVIFSFTVLGMSAGMWFQSLVMSLIASVFIERALRLTSTKELAEAL